MTHTRLLAVLLTMLLLPLVACTEQQPVSRVELGTTLLEASPLVGKIVSQRIEMAPQVAGQAHYHPVPVVGYVVAGEIAFQIKGGATQILTAGDAFFEPANAIVLRWENVGSTRAVFVAHYLATQESDELLIRVD